MVISCEPVSTLLSTMNAEQKPFSGLYQKMYCPEIPKQLEMAGGKKDLLHMNMHLIVQN